MKTRLLALFSIALFSCTDINDVTIATDKPVIEAYLAPGSPVTLKLFTEIPYDSTVASSSEPILGQKLTISTSTGQKWILQELGEGYYGSADSEVVGAVGSSYTLSFDYKGRSVKATTQIPEKPVGLNVSVSEVERTAIDFSQGRPEPGQGGGRGGIRDPQVDIDVTWNNPTKLLHFVASQSAELDALPIVKLPEGGEQGGFRIRGFGRGRFNNEPVTTDAGQIRSGSFQYFGKQAIILYRLNPDYAALYRSSGSTTQNISTPPSSISNGLGIFTGVNADTAYIYVKQKVI